LEINEQDGGGGQETLLQAMGGMVFALNREAKHAFSICGKAKGAVAKASPSLGKTSKNRQ
jgi:hypothetical protein